MFKTQIYPEIDNQPEKITKSTDVAQKKAEDTILEVNSAAAGVNIDMEKSQQPRFINSYEFNIRGFYNMEEITGTFYKLTNVDNTIKPHVIYVPKGTNGLYDYLGGGSKTKKTRRNRRKSNRRR